MSWLSSRLKKGIKVSKSFPWFGEKGLPDPNKWNPDVSKETNNKEIAESLNKKEA